MQRVLSLNDDEAEQIVNLIDKYNQMAAVPISVHAHFACDLPLTMTVVEFLSCFECYPLKQETGAVDCSHNDLAACVINSISETKKKKLGE